MGEPYVGIDLHRRRSVLVRMTPAGEVLQTVRVDNDPVALSLELAKAGPDPEVVLEATYGWDWAADLLQACGTQVHLAHPLGSSCSATSGPETDARDATNLAELLRMGRLREAWLAPPQVRELRELVRYRAQLVALRSGLKAQVHAVLAKQGVRVPMSDLFGVAGGRLLDQLQLGGADGLRVAWLRSLLGAYDQAITTLQREVTAALAGDLGYLAIQAIPGWARCRRGVFVAEIGDVHRFAAAPQWCSWAGLTPRHRESDTTVRRGPITNQGPRLVRWAAVQATQRLPKASKQAAWVHRIADRRGTGIGRVAAARRLLTLVSYGLRDGQVRCLAPAPREGDVNGSGAARRVLVGVMTPAPAAMVARLFDCARPAAAGQLHAALARRADDRHPSPLGLPTASGCWRWSCHPTPNSPLEEVQNSTNRSLAADPASALDDPQDRCPRCAAGPPRVTPSAG
jgi:transposase